MSSFINKKVYNTFCCLYVFHEKVLLNGSWILVVVITLNLCLTELCCMGMSFISHQLFILSVKNVRNFRALENVQRLHTYTHILFGHHVLTSGVYWCLNLILCLHCFFLFHLFFLKFLDVCNIVFVLSVSTIKVISNQLPFLSMITRAYHVPVDFIQSLLYQLIVLWVMTSLTMMLNWHLSPIHLNRWSRLNFHCFRWKCHHFYYRWFPWNSYVLREKNNRQTIHIQVWLPNS